MPGAHSLFWKLCLLLVGFCLIVVALSLTSGQWITSSTSYLSEDSQNTLRALATDAEAALEHGGAAGADAFIRHLIQAESSWAVLVDVRQTPLTGHTLSEGDLAKLRFVRDLDMSMGMQGGWRPVVDVPLPKGEGRLVMELPERLSPWAPRPVLYFFSYRVAPALLTLLMCIALFRFLIGPLSRLRSQAARLSAGDLSARVGEPVALRQDELGELARSFDEMAGRLEATVVYQRRLLRDLSHELRTPLSRLRAAHEREGDVEALRDRLGREVDLMQKLIEDSLELAWLDSERPRFEPEPISVAQLWEMIAEDAAFETGFSLGHLRCEVGDDCVVLANLSSLGRALENLMRNAIRHSPEEGVVTLSGSREGAHWHLVVCDQGQGVAEDQLEFIFEPFARVDRARPGDGGFGLGLSIARRAIHLQGGRLWAAPTGRGPGLAMHLVLRAVDEVE
ncbi:histidine kinase sensor domain-containing protein [Pseudomonas sp. Marseille-QA0892]